MNSERLQELLRRLGVDALLATSPENILYAAGYRPFQGVWNRFPKALIHFANGARRSLLLPISEAGFVADAETRPDLDLTLFGVSNLVFPRPGTDLDAREKAIMDWTASARPSLPDAVAELCRTRLARGARIAVDRTGAPELFDVLRDTIGEFEWLDRGEDLWRLARMVKTEDEVAKLAAAAALNQSAIATMLDALGTTDDAGLERRFREAVAAGGGNLQHFVGNAGRRAGAYRGAGSARARSGERFRFDVGIELDGYCSDLGGTAQLGAAPSPGESRVYHALTAGIDRALDVARPGIRTSDLYREVIGAVRKAGLPDYRFSLAGHGIGVEPRDLPIVAPPMRTASPFIDPVFDPLLEERMVINIECPLNCLGEGAYQHEITMVIRGNGAELLSDRREYLVVGRAQ